MADTIKDSTVFLYFPTAAKFNNKKSQIPAKSVTFIADTGQIYANGTLFGGNTTTPKAHTSNTASTYGGATADLYGHVKLFDAAGVQAAKDSAAATPYALNNVKSALSSEISGVKISVTELSDKINTVDGRINTDVVNYLSTPEKSGLSVTNNTDASSKKYGSISLNAKATDVSTLIGGSSERVYAVGIDASGNLAVKVPWGYTHPSHTAITKTST